MVFGKVVGTTLFSSSIQYWPAFANLTYSSLLKKCYQIIFKNCWLKSKSIQESSSPTLLEAPSGRGGRDDSASPQPPRSPSGSPQPPPSHTASMSRLSPQKSPQVKKFEGDGGVERSSRKFFIWDKDKVIFWSCVIWSEQGPHVVLSACRVLFPYQPLSAWHEICIIEIDKVGGFHVKLDVRHGGVHAESRSYLESSSCLAYFWPILGLLMVTGGTMQHWPYCTYFQV